MTRVKNKRVVRCNTRFVTNDDKPGLTGLLLLLLLVLSATFSVVSQADGLFNFQMKLAKQGNAEAQFKVGEMYATGFGVKQDRKEAMKWITQAAKKGHETANFQLLYWDLEKNGLTEANKVRLKVLKEKAANANAHAEYYLGKMYAHGVGVRKNDGKSIKWLNQAALVGVLEAEREMGAVREDQQKQVLQKQRAEERKRVQLKAKQEAERQKVLEAQRKLQLQKQQEQKARAEALHKKQQVDAAAAAKKQKNKQVSAAQKRAQVLAEQHRLEEKRQALLKQRAAEEKKRKTEFESDPCSGRSARFLSTCR